MCSPRQGADPSRSSQELLSPCQRKDKHPAVPSPVTAGPAGKRSRKGNPGGVLSALLFRHLAQLMKPLFIRVLSVCFGGCRSSRAEQRKALFTNPLAASIGVTKTPL